MTGRVAVRNGNWYAVISYKNSLGQYKQKWINTGLKERGNKKAAQKFLDEQMQSYNYDNESTNEVETKQEGIDTNISFVDYVEKFVNDKKELSPTTIEGYESCLRGIKRYFGSELKLKDVTYQHIEEFYDYLRNEKHNKNVTIKHYAVVLSPALRQAYRDDLIPKNPYEFLPKLRREKSVTAFYNKNELEKLFEVTKNTPLALIVKVAAYYGLRRSELLGLRWKSIDFEKKTITIEHKIVVTKKKLHKKDKLKNEASLRTLPLLPEIEQELIEKREEIEKNKVLYGKSYNHSNDDYVFVNDFGNIILPDYVTKTFASILEKNGMRHIRFHDLRHSCASLLLSCKVPMKNIQEWLGHANYNTTADVYSHLDFSSKLYSAQIIENQLSKTEEQKQLDEEIEMLKKKLLEKAKREKLFEFDL